MGGIKQLEIIKIHPSGWPYIAGIATVSFLIGTLLGLPITLFICSTLFVMFLFRVKTPIISTEQKLILAPLSGKIEKITEIISPYKFFLLHASVQKIVIRCGLFTSASLHAPTSMQIMQKQKIEEASSRLILLRASLLETEGYDDSDEILMIFSSTVPYLFSECNIEIGDTLSKGQTFGFLPFGGKLDLLVPEYFSLKKIENQTCTSGETILAKRR